MTDTATVLHAKRAGREAVDRRGYCRSAQAAAYLGMSRSGLSRMRTDGRGPRYSRRGQTVFYAYADLDAWVNGEDL